MKNIRQRDKNNKLKIIAPMRNDEHKLPDASYSVSNIQDHTEDVIKKNETLSTKPPIHIYVNRINNILVFKIIDGYKLELKTIKTMELFRSTKTLIDKTKNRENVLSIETVEVVLVQRNLGENQ